MRTARITGAESLGAILREARSVSGLTQQDMALRLGVDRRYIVEIEQGKPTKALERLFEFMRETGVRLYADVDSPMAHGDDHA
jgi:HTH-type transcriptional regulator / antitoxin HipB